MSASPIKLYYYRNSDGTSNFGDELSPLIIERVIGRPTVWAHQAQCQIAAIGSILGGILHRRWRRWLSMRFDPVHIWGSGFIRPHTDGPHPMLKCHAVRGHSSRDALGLPEGTALGDPGLLASRLFDRRPKKRYSWAIVPHRADSHLPVVRVLQAAMPYSVCVDLSDDPVKILKTIASADYVLSTSLHGLVIADAFGVPSVWTTMTGKVSGDRFKFEDYYSALGITPPERINVTTPFRLHTLEQQASCAPAAAVEACNDRLIRAFPAL